MAAVGTQLAADASPRHEALVGDRLPSIEILGQRILAATGEATLSLIRSAAGANRVRVAYVNAHTLNLACSDVRLRQALLESDFVLNDGIGVSLAARLRGRSFPTNLHGSAFNTHLLRMSAEEGWPVFLLGARPGIAEKAGAELARSIPSLQIVGARHGFHHRPEADVEVVAASGAEVLLVGMGNPRQEIWLLEHISQLPRVRLAVGVGAYLDFQSGAVRRAPQWMNECGIEWAYRLAQEPRRLAGRYLVGSPHFLFRAVAETLPPGNPRRA